MQALNLVRVKKIVREKGSHIASKFKYILEATTHQILALLNSIGADGISISIYLSVCYQASKTLLCLGEYSWDGALLSIIRLGSATNQKGSYYILSLAMAINPPA